MRQVTIIGLGLIGASLGLALKQSKNPPLVIGNDLQYDAAKRAGKLKAVDKVERYLPDAVAGSDLVIVATPVGSIPEVFARIAESLSEDCVVTDTGSTKREILRKAGEILPPRVGFVGGHPMTGRLTGGVDAPEASLFQNSVYCLVPSPTAPNSAVDTMVRLVQQIGAATYFVDAEEHDGLVAGVSHLPYLLSTALVRSLASGPGWREMSALAAGGFEIATRLAAHDPRMFADILATNGDNVVRQLDRLVEQLEGFRSQLVAERPDLFGALEQAQKDRLEWEVQRRRAAGQSK